MLSSSFARDIRLSRLAGGGIHIRPYLLAATAITMRRRVASSSSTNRCISKSSFSDLPLKALHGASPHSPAGIVALGERPTGLLVVTLLEATASTWTPGLLPVEHSGS
jgi:hypothetical protein